MELLLGFIAAVGSVLAAAFSILAWRAQRSDSKPQCEVLRDDAGEGAAKRIRVLISNPGPVTLSMCKARTRVGTFAMRKSTDSTLLVDSSSKYTGVERRIILPGECEDICLWMFHIDDPSKLRATVHGHPDRAVLFLQRKRPWQK